MGVLFDVMKLLGEENKEKAKAITEGKEAAREVTQEVCKLLSNSKK